MMAVGEQSGRFAETMQMVADVYERELDRRIKVATAIIPPIIIVIIAMLVGAVVFSIISAVFSVTQAACTHTHALRHTRGARGRFVRLIRRAGSGYDLRVTSRATRFPCRFLLLARLLSYRRLAAVHGSAAAVACAVHVRVRRARRNSSAGHAAVSALARPPPGVPNASPRPRRLGRVVRATSAAQTATGAAWKRVSRHSPARRTQPSEPLWRTTRHCEQGEVGLPHPCPASGRRGEPSAGAGVFRRPRRAMRRPRIVPSGTSRQRVDAFRTLWAKASACLPPRRCSCRWTGSTTWKSQTPGDGSQVRGVFLTWLETREVLQPADFPSDEAVRQPFGILAAAPHTARRHLPLRRGDRPVAGRQTASC